MTKNEILDYLSKVDWDDELKDRLETAVAKYVVCQGYPDDSDDSCHYYDYRYYISKEDAEKDFESRDYVPFGACCYCYIASLHFDFDDDLFYRKRRQIV